MESLFFWAEHEARCWLSMYYCTLSVCVASLRISICFLSNICFSASNSTNAADPDVPLRTLNLYYHFSQFYDRKFCWPFGSLRVKLKLSKSDRKWSFMGLTVYAGRESDLVRVRNLPISFSSYWVVAEKIILWLICQARKTLKTGNFQFIHRQNIIGRSLLEIFFLKQRSFSFS